MKKRKPSQAEEFSAIMTRTVEAMNNPASNCGFCGIKLHQYNRQWDGSRWVCDNCAEKHSK